MPPECLFTSVDLPSDTEEEHTIPKSIGGRITSHIVSSSDFNHASGDQIDPILKRTYEPILNHLAPLLPSSSQPGRMPVDLRDEHGGYFLEKGELSRNRRILKRDEQGVPKTVVAETVESLQSLARSMRKSPDEFQISVVPATDEQVFRRKSPVICHEIEIAVLKSSLLTFDHLLADNPNRFSRSVQLEPVRQFIRDAVVDRRIDPTQLHQISMGLQYDKMSLYDRLRNLINVPRTPFEHFLVVATNLPARCLELVWLVFGFDPFGFRLCTQWSGEQFSFAIINPVIRDSAASGPHQLPGFDELLCAPTNFCSIPHAIGDGDNMDGVMEEVMNRISLQRGNAYMEAVDLVENNSDEALKGRFVEAAALSEPGKRSLRSQIRQRLVGIYGRKADSVAFVEAVEAVVAQRFSDSEIACLDVELPNDLDVDWRWTESLGLYRACLADLKLQFGLPGDWFSESGRILPDPSNSRLAGATLDMT
jgi:hypothetical protein